jgi:hypothetical protein
MTTWGLRPENATRQSALEFFILSRRLCHHEISGLKVIRTARKLLLLSLGPATGKPNAPKNACASPPGNRRALSQRPHASRPAAAARLAAQPRLAPGCPARISSSRPAHQCRRPVWAWLPVFSAWVGMSCSPWDQRPAAAPTSRLPPRGAHFQPWAVTVQPQWNSLRVNVKPSRVSVRTCVLRSCARGVSALTAAFIAPELTSTRSRANSVLTK